MSGSGSKYLRQSTVVFAVLDIFLSNPTDPLKEMQCRRTIFRETGLFMFGIAGITIRLDLG